MLEQPHISEYSEKVREIAQKMYLPLERKALLKIEGLDSVALDELMLEKMHAGHDEDNLGEKLSVLAQDVISHFLAENHGEDDESSMIAAVKEHIDMLADTMATHIHYYPDGRSIEVDGKMF